jgi:hypothetical protein
LLFLGAGDELAVYQSVECLYVGEIFLDAFGVELDCHEFVFLGLVALGADEGAAALHFAVTVGVLELEFEGGEALFVLFVLEEGAGGQDLETYVVAQQFVLLEEGVHLLEVTVAEVAFAQQVDAGDVRVAQGD